MFRRFLSNKFFLVGGSLVVLLALGVVLGLVVVRVQNERATILQPQAASSCTSQPGCCGNIASGGGFDKCGWPDRGWCTLEQCAKSDSNQTYDCNRGGGPKNCNCGLFVRTYCQPAPGTCTQSAECPAGQTCLNGKCASNPCWVNVPIPKGWAPTGQISGTAPTFSWDFDTTYSSNVTGVAVYLYDTNPGPTTAARWSAFGQSGSFKSAALSQFGVTSLQPNTQYWWLVVTNSYAPPTQQYACMKMQTFTTGSGTGGGQTHLACQNSACVAVAGAGNNTDGCTAPGQACTTTTTCTVDSECPGQVCAEGSCVDPGQSHLGCAGDVCARKKGAGNNTDGCTVLGGNCSLPMTHFECVDKACKSVSGAGDNKNGCTSAGGSCCSSNSDCTTGLSCDTTKAPNVCSAANEVNVCWGNGGNNGKCYDCNGDGEINTLDFSCFRKLYLKNI